MCSAVVWLHDSMRHVVVVTRNQSAAGDPQSSKGNIYTAVLDQVELLQGDYINISKSSSEVSECRYRQTSVLHCEIILLITTGPLRKLISGLLDPTGRLST